MADAEKINHLLEEIDMLTGNSGPKATAAQSAPESLADMITEQTGLPTTQVLGDPNNTDEQNAYKAAMVAIIHFSSLGL